MCVPSTARYAAWNHPVCGSLCVPVSHTRVRYDVRNRHDVTNAATISDR